jgi:hypothetical protein
MQKRMAARDEVGAELYRSRCYRHATQAAPLLGSAPRVRRVARHEFPRVSDGAASDASVSRDLSIDRLRPRRVGRREECRGYLGFDGQVGLFVHVDPCAGLAEPSFNIDAL